MLLNGLPNSCKGCPLSDNPHSGFFTRVTGVGRSGVLIVGEASEEHEAREAKPFIDSAPAGSILEKAIRLSGLSRDDFFITNLIRCRPINNQLLGAPYERSAIDHCNSNLRNVIEQYRPKAILALGAIPTRELTGFSGGKKSISYVRGYPIPGPGGIITIPSYHPSYIVRGYTAYIPLLVKDINSARSAAAGRLTYIIDPSIEMRVYEGIKALEDFYTECLKDPEVWIAYDTETPQSQKGVEDELVEFNSRDEGEGLSGFSEGEYSDLSGLATSVCDKSEIPFDSSNKGGANIHNDLDSGHGEILSIQFAISDQWGVYGDWKDGRIRELAQKILALPNPKIAHNGDHFDRPILEREGIYILGDHYDSLSMRRALQPDLPGGLQQIAVDYGWRWPWKHYSGTNAILYGVADVCSLVRIASKLPLELDRLGMWDGYQRYVVETREKVELPWQRRGIPLNTVRLDETREWLTTEVGSKLEELLTFIPDELHIKEPTKDGFANLPEEIKPLVYSRHPELFEHKPRFRKDGSPYLDKEGNQVYYKKDPYTVTQIYHMLLDGTLDGTLELVLVTFPDLKLREDGKSLYRHIPFNPRSSQQMIKYLKHKGYEVPKSFKEGKETTSDKLMRRLGEKTKDPVISLTRSIRAFEKMRDSYTGKIREDGVVRGGWIPEADGRLRVPTMTNSNWQYSSVGVNVFTLPKRREELAKRFRKCVMAEEDHVMIEFDFKSFHDLTTAALATDEVKWRTARLDGHSYTAGHLVKYPGIHKALELSDDDLREFLKEIKAKYPKIRDEQAKPLNHGTNFGQGYNRLYFENEEYFDSPAQAKQMLLMLRRVYPKTFKWQEELLKSLDVGGGRTPYLQSVWGARRWFWDVWSWKKDSMGRWYQAKGQDAEKALAYLPANNAHGMFRKKLLEAAELEYLDRYELVLFPHDAWVFHPPKELADECIYNIKSLMEAPVIELANPVLCPNGFVCEVDVAVGPSMGEMSEVK